MTETSVREELHAARRDSFGVARQPRRVLLIAGIDAVGVGRLPKLFASAGFQVMLLASHKLAVANSRYVRQRFSAPPGPEATAHAARAHLAIYRDRYEEIILADEPTLWAALRLGSREWLEGWFPVPLDADSINLIDSKVAFLVAAQQAGLRVPPFEVCRNAEEALRAARALGYPIFVKGSRGIAGSGLRFAHGEADFESQLTSFPIDEPVLVQAPVEGDAGSISVLYDHGRPVCWFSYLMKQTWPNRFSSASALQIVSHPDADQLVSGVGAMTGYHGLCGIDWVRERRQNRLFLLEFNPRPTPVYYLGQRVCADFAAGLNALRTGAATYCKTIAGENLMLLFPQNLYYTVDHRLPLQFLRTFADAPWGDPSMVLSHLRRFVTHYIPKDLKRMLRGS